MRIARVGLLLVPLAALPACNPTAGDSPSAVGLSASFEGGTSIGGTGTQIGFFSDVADDNGNPKADDLFTVTVRSFVKVTGAPTTFYTVNFESYQFSYSRPDGR